MEQLQAGSVGRRAVLRGMLALGGGLVMGACSGALQSAPGSASAAVSSGRLSGGRISVRWLGGGVVELATPDGKQMAYADAWVWNNTGWTAFSVPKPPEYATKEGFLRYVANKQPDAVFVLLTHDHADHIGDYFEMLKGLVAAGVPVMTAGQSDLMRKGLVDDFEKAGLDRAKLVVNAGNGVNFGGAAKHGAMTVHLVPAVHSNLRGFPSAGFMLDIGGMRVYLSGDTDLYGDMKLLGERYQPNLAVVCVGDGGFAMGPQDAARACQWMGVSHAIPVHYAHNNLNLGPQAGDEFRQAMASIAHNVSVIIMKPGDTRTIQT